MLVEMRRPCKTHPYKLLFSDGGDSGSEKHHIFRVHLLPLVVPSLPAKSQTWPWLPLVSPVSTPPCPFLSICSWDRCSCDDIFQVSFWEKRLEEVDSCTKNLSKGNEVNFYYEISYVVMTESSQQLICNLWCQGFPHRDEEKLNNQH